MLVITEFAFPPDWDTPTNTPLPYAAHVTPLALVIAATSAVTSTTLNFMFKRKLGEKYISSDSTPPFVTVFLVLQRLQTTHLRPQKRFFILSWLHNNHCHHCQAISLWLIILHPSIVCHKPPAALNPSTRRRYPIRRTHHFLTREPYMIVTPCRAKFTDFFNS